LRRIVQTVVLLVMILTGSLPGLQWAAAAAGSCCATMPRDACPCRTPSGAPGSGAPCWAAAPAVALVAAPCRAAQAASAPRRREPSPLPPACLALAAPRPLAAGPVVLPRPGPAPPLPPDLTQAALSVFRI